jgi:AraC-like DNA-binding protein
MRRNLEERTMQPHSRYAGPLTVSVQTADPDEARAVCGEHLYPRTMRLLDPSARLNARFSFLHLGGLTLGDVQYGAEVAGAAGEFNSYHLNVPIAGTFAACQADRPIRGHSAQAAVYRPVGATELHYASADCHMLSLKIERSSLERQLATMLDTAVHHPIRFAASLDIGRYPGRSCAELVRFLAAEIDNPTGLIYEPMVAAPLEEGLLMALLMATDHQYHDQLQGRPSRSTPWRVRQAIDAIHAEPRQPYTVTVLAQIAGVSPLQLREEFQRQTGMPPMAYIREVRLAGAHAELVHSDPDQSSVTTIARRWGFLQVSRFTARYRAHFHVAPTTTLRHRRG